MKILIIGGTRFIGPCVVRRLYAEKHEITLFHRGKSKANLPGNITHIQGDRRNLKDFKIAFHNIKPDIVLDMIPITENDALQIVETFKSIASRIVALSSQDVYRAYGILIGTEEGKLEKIPLREDAALRKNLYPYRGGELRDEDDPQKALDNYDKIPVESVYLTNNQIPGTILRLPAVYGPGDYQHRLREYLKRIDDNRPAILLEEGLAKWQWTRGYVENIADAIVLTIYNEKAANQIYNIGEQRPLTTRMWVEQIARVAEWEGKIVTIPKEKLPDEMIPKMNTSQHLVSDTTKIRKELDYEEHINNNTALERTIQWERENKPEKTSDKQFDYETEDKILKKLGIKP
jgi:nucleoside-diphosphate-sugar epimerase